MASHAAALFRVPPFPRARPIPIIRANPDAPRPGEADVAAFIAAVRAERVGGAYWSTRDPWQSFVSGETPSFAADDPLALLAAIADAPIQLTGDGPFRGLDREPERLPELVARHLLVGITYRDPFTGAPTSPVALVRQLGAWRRLIERNRAIHAAYGFAGWKRDTVAALLWDGIRPPPFVAPRLSALPPEGAVAIWKARVPERFLETLEQSGRTIWEVEDGFIRSVGLGADCVPPLSIVLDDLGAHYDPSRPSRLEEAIARPAAVEELARAAALRERIAARGISKYGVSGGEALPRPAGNRTHILVIGQVEDDRSVRLGGCGLTSNLELLRRARATNPDAHIIYRPHPDVVAGHRRGAIPTGQALTFADGIDPGNPISALIAMVDAVHVLTSLAGFEALLHGKAVTTHGVPFYAGWGLTTDLGPVPARRSAAVSLDQLVAATLIDYPLYLDPVSGLPCPPEILLQRIEGGTKRQNRALVQARRGLGWVKRRLKR